MKANNLSSKRLPPFGKALAEMLQWNNPPGLVVVFIGADSWSRAKDWNNLHPEMPALVVPSDCSVHAFSWPVSGCVVVLRKRPGPSDEKILEITKLLLRNGAEIVTLVDDIATRILAKYVAKVVL